MPEASASARPVLAGPAMQSLRPAWFAAPAAWRRSQLEPALGGALEAARRAPLILAAALSLLAARSRPAAARRWQKPVPRSAPVVAMALFLATASLAQGALAPPATRDRGRALRSVMADAPGRAHPGAQGIAAGSAEAWSGRGSPFLADGTLLKPVLVDGAVTLGIAARITIYTVRPGDTLSGIAARFGVTMMTLWWANHLESKDLLHVGQRLRVPPVSGVLYAVRDGDTLESIARTTHGDVEAIRAFNGLGYGSLLVGQLLMIPGGRGAPIPASETVTRTTTRAPAPTPLPEPVAVLTGVASWMYASGTAMRLPVGTLVHICGDGGCILRRVTSWGPSASLDDRIVDLNYLDFPIVCGCSLSTGLAWVRVEVLPDD